MRRWPRGPRSASPGPRASSSTGASSPARSPTRTSRTSSMMSSPRRSEVAPMTLVQHLEEVRHRFLFCVAPVMVGTAVAFVFHDAILAVLLRPLPAQAGALEAIGGGHRIAVTGVGEAFAVVLKL